MWLTGIVMAGVAIGVLMLRTWHAAPASGSEQVLVHVAYQAQTFEEMATGAGAVLAGRVARISPTMWNQDDGTYWEESTARADGGETTRGAVPYYEIELLVADTIVDEVGVSDQVAVGRPVVLTVIGMNPEDERQAIEAIEGVRVADGDTHLAVGDQALVFAEPSRMAWRTGTRPVLQLMGDPAASAMPMRPDGAYDAAGQSDAAPATLDALKDRVLALRAGDPTE